MHHFIIAIGGTGMRCLESFVHLCAMGMMDDCEIDILTLDTDAENGNRVRVEQLIDQYNKVKGYTASDTKDCNSGISNNTFFSAKLNKFSYYTIYSQERGTTFKRVFSNQCDAFRYDDFRQRRTTAERFQFDSGRSVGNSDFF